MSPFIAYIEFNLKKVFFLLSGLHLSYICLASALHMCKADVRQMQIRYKFDIMEYQNEIEISGQWTVDSELS